MKNFIANELKNRLFIIIMLTLCLWIFIFSYSYATLDTGTHKLNLNDGKPVVEELNFAPGTIIEREFFVENISDQTIDFRLYFDELEGNLKDVLNFKIKDNAVVLIEGKMTDFTKKSFSQKKFTLKAHEKKTYTIEFYFDKHANNEYQNATIEFDIKAIGTWRSKN